MNDVINGNEIHIKNAKILDPEYEYAFHQYYEDHKSVLLVYLVLPGIRSNTIHLDVFGNKISLTAFFIDEFERMFGSKKILIEGSLKDKVLPNVFSIEYEAGIAKITLIVDNDLVKSLDI